MISSLPSVHTIAPMAAALSALPNVDSVALGLNDSLATSYASYVVRVHTRNGIKTLSFDILAELFTLTAKKAAEELGISSRTLIRVCRSLGIRRWPYLGFRSERNVERIRQEAMENLHHKLKLGGNLSPTTVLHPGRRGPSAKRLLQVKTTQPGLLSQQREASPETHEKSPCSSPTISTTTTTLSDDDECMLEPDPLADAETQETPLSRLPFSSAASPFARLSPGGVTSSNDAFSSSLKRDYGVTRPTSPIPSLNLLVDASIITRIKRDKLSKNIAQECTAHTSKQVSSRSRTMSMHDILAA